MELLRSRLASFSPASLTAFAPFPTEGAIFLGERVRVLRAGTLPPPASRPVLYWMQRDQRVRDNWALLHAASLARAARAPLVVVFCLLTAAPPLATARSTGFQLRGLAEVEADLCALRIPFRLLLGGAGAQVGGYAAGVQAGAVVTDFSPLREARACKEEVARALAPGVMAAAGTGNT